MFKYFDNKFNNMQNQLKSSWKYETFPFKNAKRESKYNFKRIRNQKQFNCNIDRLNDIQESIHHVRNKDKESAHFSLTSINNKLKKRKKLMRIADKSEAAWLIREEYQNDSTASDPRNSWKICQAKQRALQKQKTKSSIFISTECFKSTVLECQFQSWIYSTAQYHI